MDRRSFISNLAAFGGGLGIACSSLGRRAEVLAQTGDLSRFVAAGYGELFPTAAKNTGETYITLPKGFEYNVVGKLGGIMADGRPTPRAHDGMATFKVGRELRIVRNHEVTGGRIPRAGSAIGAANHYDEMAGGGTTTLVVDPKTRLVTRDFVSLSGTLVNCAGGPTPWSSWISCEETTIGRSIRTLTNGTKIGGFPKPHGYCFEVMASANINLPPVPLKAMGRFVHEAVSVDGRSGVVYLTEDYNPCGLYRFLPNRNKRLAEGGTLQVLAVKGKPEYDTRTNQTMRATLAANWITVSNPDPEAADMDELAVFKQVRELGAASFARLEGCCIDKTGRLYFTATSGGDSRGGQIWSYEPTGRDEGRLTLLFESPSRRLLDMPDNLTLMPKSDLLFVCEDSDYAGDGGTPENCIRILTPEGRIADFAVNVFAGNPKSEFAGTTFSNDGKTLFFNIQGAGVTTAVWGNWSKFRS